ncbi:MAG: hypothetical protein U0903_15110 [Planctomycetales bacterium]
MQNMDFLPGSLNLSFVEGIYADYLENPASVPAKWQHYFEQMRREEGNGIERQVGPSFRPRSLFNPVHSIATIPSLPAPGEKPNAEIDAAARQDRVDQLIRNYRVRGHRMAHLDPLVMPPEEFPDELEPSTFGFTPEDMDRPFSTVTIRGDDVRTLRRIVGRLRKTYCRFIGVQFMHIDDIQIRE